MAVERRVAAFTYSDEPVPVRVVPVFEPFVDENIGRVVVESLADKLKLAHGEAGGLSRRISPALLAWHDGKIYRLRMLWIESSAKTGFVAIDNSWVIDKIIWMILQPGKLIF